MTSPVVPRAKAETVTIPSGEALTAAINLNGRAIVGIIMPGTWTAAAITMQACDTADGTFVDVIATGGSELSITAAASDYLAVDPVNQYGINFAKDPVWHLGDACEPGRGSRSSADAGGSAVILLPSLVEAK